MPNFRLLCCVILGFALAACQNAGDSFNSEQPVVLTTFTVLQDIGQNVAGEHLIVESITKPGVEIHKYEPTPKDVRKASRAALILDNGLGLEAWFAKFVEDSNAPHVVVSTGIDVLDISGDPAGRTPNPHAWVSPVNAEIYVDNIADAFAELAPQHADEFHANAEAYKSEIRTVQTQTTEALAAIPAAKRALVTCEGAFSYLARDAGLDEKYLWMVNAEQQVTARQLANVIEFVKGNEIPAVFCESTVSDRTMQQVVNATGTRFGGNLYVDSLSKADGEVPTYLDLLRHNAKTISTGLSGNKQ